MQFYFLNIAESVSMDQDPATSMQLPDVAQLVRIWASSLQLDTCLCLAVFIVGSIIPHYNFPNL